jgi:hypothetical protein
MLNSNLEKLERRRPRTASGNILGPDSLSACAEDTRNNRERVALDAGVGGHAPGRPAEPARRERGVR